MSSTDRCPPQTKMNLADFIAMTGRVVAARKIGCTGPALLKAMNAGRTIFVEVAENGAVTAIETKSFPGR